MDIRRAINYPMLDPNWVVKLLIGVLVSAIPFINFIMIGFQLRATRMVMGGVEDRLPEWDQWSDDFMRGLYSVVGGVVYFLPVTLLFCCLGIMSTALGEDSGLSMLMYCCAMPVMILYSIVAGAMLLVANLRYAATWDFNNSFFDFAGRWQDVQKYMNEILIFALYVILLGAVIGLSAALTIILCGLGLLIIVGGQLIIAHLQAQLGIQLGLGGFKS